MQRLEQTVETRSLELLGDARPEGADWTRAPLPDPGNHGPAKHASSN